MGCEFCAEPFYLFLKGDDVLQTVRPIGFRLFQLGSKLFNLGMERVDVVQTVRSIRLGFLQLRPGAVGRSRLVRPWLQVDAPKVQLLRYGLPQFRIMLAQRQGANVRLQQAMSHGRRCAGIVVNDRIGRHVYAGNRVPLQGKLRHMRPVGVISLFRTYSQNVIVSQSMMNCRLIIPSVAEIPDLPDPSKEILRPGIDADEHDPRVEMRRVGCCSRFMPSDGKARSVNGRAANVCVEPDDERVGIDPKYEVGCLEQRLANEWNLAPTAFAAMPIEFKHPHFVTMGFSEGADARNRDCSNVFECFVVRREYTNGRCLLPMSRHVILRGFGLAIVNQGRQWIPNDHLVSNVRNHSGLPVDMVVS